MAEYPAVLTALVPAAIRTALTGHGVSLCGEDVPDPVTLLDALAASAADCMILHMSVADNFGRRRFFREVQKRKPMPMIVIGSKSDATDDGVKKLLKDSLVTALVTDSRDLVDELLDALAAVEPSKQPACNFGPSCAELSLPDLPGFPSKQPACDFDISGIEVPFPHWDYPKRGRHAEK